MSRHCPCTRQVLVPVPGPGSQGAACLPPPSPAACRRLGVHEAVTHVETDGLGTSGGHVRPVVSSPHALVSSKMTGPGELGHARFLLSKSALLVLHPGHCARGACAPRNNRTLSVCPAARQKRVDSWHGRCRAAVRQSLHYIGLSPPHETHLCDSQISGGNLKTFTSLFLANNLWEGDEGRIFDCHPVFGAPLYLWVRK